MPNSPTPTNNTPVGATDAPFPRAGLAGAIPCDQRSGGSPFHPRFCDSSVRSEGWSIFAKGGMNVEAWKEVNGK